MAFVVRVDLFHAGDGGPKVREGEKPFTHGQPFTQACVLNQHWPSGRQVANASVAEPTVARLHVEVLRYTELSARGLDEGTIGGGRLRDEFAWSNFPSVLGERLRFRAHDGQPELLGGELWQI